MKYKTKGIIFVLFGLVYVCLMIKFYPYEKHTIELNEIFGIGQYVDIPIKQYMEVPSVDTSFKSFMDYRTITNILSVQYKMQQEAITDEYGFRLLDGKYMVAVGTYYAKECGVELHITLESGVTIECIVADIKQDAHTNETNQYVPINGNLVEFIVDVQQMESTIFKTGSVSDVKDELSGSVVAVEKK